MNIGIITTWFERGAAYVSRQYREVLQGPHEVFIYARSGEKFAIDDPRWNDDRVTWAKQGVVPVPMSMDLDHFASWLREKRIDVAFFNEQHWWEPVVLCDRLKVTCGAYIDYYTRETVPLFGAYDFLICNTRRHFSVFENHPRAVYIPWGTDLDVFRPRTLAPVRPGEVTFFHSGGMNPPRKGTDYVIRAFAALDGPCRLVIHSQLNLESVLPDLGSTISGLVGAGRLEIRQETVGAPGLYHLGDVYVYPSRLDGIGLTVAEALACGLPVITTDNPPMNEFVDGTNGRVVRVKSHGERQDGYYWPQSFVDEEDLKIQMQSMVQDPDSLASRKTAARQYAEKNLDWRKNAAPLAEIFGSMQRSASPSKAAAIRAAKQFESRRARQSVRSWLSYHYPAVVRSARDLFRALRSSAAGAQ